MMKYKTGVLGLMLAGFLLFPVTADAAQEEIEIQPEGNQGQSRDTTAGESEGQYYFSAAWL